MKGVLPSLDTRYSPHREFALVETDGLRIFPLNWVAGALADYRPEGITAKFETVLVNSCREQAH